MAEAGSFDLLSRRKEGWKPDAALVVSPYVEAEFFERLGRDLKPKHLHIVIDDGCRREDRDTVLNALKAGGYKTEPHLQLGSARGLVHIKLFYVRWKTAGGRSSHTLVFGSANASRQGFSGRDNAELVADATLTASAHSEIIEWCEKVMGATRAIGETQVPAAHSLLLSKGVRLRLPAIRVGRTVSAVSNFDLWIQRGSLLSTYRPDPSFLRIVLPLTRALPPGEQAQLAAEAGFEIAQTKSIRHSYIQDGPDDAVEEVAPSDMGNWRRKLFTWTHLGEWCSEACDIAHRLDFKRRFHEQRAAAIAQLDGLRCPDARDTLRNAFLDKIDGLWRAFGDDARAILRGGRDLDRDHYAALFDGRVERDLEWIADAEFRDRYITGYEVVQVPRFRSDVLGWLAFVESLGRQLVLDDQRDRNQSRLLTTIRDAVDEVETDRSALQDSEQMIAFLRKVFERKDKTARYVARAIRDYHRL